MAFDSKANAKIKAADSRRMFSDQLDANKTIDIISLGFASEKVSFQATGNLAGTIEFSINGKDFFGSAAISTTPSSYSTHNVSSVKITRTSGSGKLAIAAK